MLKPMTDEIIIIDYIATMTTVKRWDKVGFKLTVSSWS